MVNFYDHVNKDNLFGNYLGNYRLLRFLRRGRFSSVYLGEHQYLKRLAAIKVLNTVIAEEEGLHFLTEAQLLATLKHPHIVRVLEFTFASKRTFIQNSVIIRNIPFLVMDYIPGGNLRAIHPVGAVLSLDTVTGYIQQIAEALQYAHTQRIVHRDIKPENLLLNERQEIMLSDFGLALFASQSSMNLPGIVGTYPYTAPEQLQGNPVFASDQYSLAVIVYEWLCGHPPFVGSEAEVVMQHISSPPPSLRRDNAFVSREVESVILKALAKEPSQRYETVQAFAQALQESAQHHPYTINQPIDPFDVPQNEKETQPFFYYLSQDPLFFAESTNSLSIRSTRETQKSVSHLPPLALRNRHRMLQKVRAFWIDGVLEPSLHEHTLITTVVREKPDAVAPLPFPTYSPFEKYQQASEISIIEVYKQARGNLLLLGEAGSGKTTLLLQLARYLLNCAEQDDLFPLPVVFPLSSWSEKQLPLDQWFVEELTTKYLVPRPLAQGWLSSESLLPLLDGLDEVAENVRSACVTAINTYKQEHVQSQMVVCSRLAEYLLFPPRVLLQRAIVIQPLTRQQVNAYFQNTGDNFAVISETLRLDPLLCDLITTPLMLRIITLTYQERSPSDILTMRSSGERYQRILATYVQQMLSRNSISEGKTSLQVTAKLAFLAKKMLQNNQVVFYVEQIQPEWIDKKGWRFIYMWFAVLLPGVFMSVLTSVLLGLLTNIVASILHFQIGSISSFGMDVFYGIIVGYLYSGRPSVSPLLEKQPCLQLPSTPSQLQGRSVQTMLFVGLITFLLMGSMNGWIIGLINGALLALLSIPIDRYIRTTRDVRAHTEHTNLQHRDRSKEKPSLKHLVNGILIGAAFGLISVITILVHQKVPGDILALLVTTVLPDSLRYALWGMLLSLLLIQNDGTIHCTEIMSWSWKKFFRSFKSRNSFYNLLIGFGMGFVFSGRDLFQGHLNSIISSSLLGLVATLSMCLISATLQGISSDQINDRYRKVLNEGIKRSFFYGTISLIISIVVFILFIISTDVLSLILASGSLVFIRESGIQASLHTAFVTVYPLALIGGLLAALLFGWFAVWQHYVLRIILRFTAPFPLKLSDFLSFATGSALLRRGGGGYLFIHQALLDYFSSLADPLTHDEE